MASICDATGRPRFYSVGGAVYEHGSERLIASAPNLPHGEKWWIDGGMLSREFAGQKFYYDAGQT